MPTFFTRAILVDIARFKSVEMVPKRYNVTVSDITQGDRVYDNGTLFYDWDQTRVEKRNLVCI